MLLQRIQAAYSTQLKTNTFFKSTALLSHFLFLSVPTSALDSIGSNSNIHNRYVTTSGNNSTAIMSKSIDVWIRDTDPDAFAQLSHPGYTENSDSTSFTGGWLAHRQAPSVIKDDATGEETVDWIQEAGGVAEMITKFDYNTMSIGRAPRILVLYGSLRETSFSRKLAYEFARILEVTGCDVRIFCISEFSMNDGTNFAVASYFPLFLGSCL